MKRAVFPGSFDPMTVGHKSIIERALKIFDEIIVAVGVNNTKSAMFDIDQRVKWIDEIFADEPKIKIDKFTGLTVDYCKKVDAKFILRGLRTSADFEFERSIGQLNKYLDADLETVFLLTATSHTPITSSIVRDIIRHNGNTKGLIPEEIYKDISENKKY